MLFKTVLIYFWLFRLILCDKSVTIVLDTTSSMQEELDIIKTNLASAINVTQNSDISNYIIVPFNDPGVGEPIVVDTARKLLSSLNSFIVTGGHKCPENSLSGIEKALEISKPQSNIFVFTDAYSKDVNKLGSIENLCRSTRSQVVIFLSGYCLPSESAPNVNIQVYYDVAKACSGAVIRFDPTTLRQAFKYIKEVINVQWTDIVNYDTFTEYKEFSFSVDSITKTVLLVASGEFPTVDISTPHGSSRTIEKIVDSRHTQVIRLTEPSVGEYRLAVRCRGKTSVVLYRKYELPLQFGFSTKLPRSIHETSKRPMPGRSNYILIEVLQRKIKLETIEIQVENDPNKKVLMLEEKAAGLYVTSTFIQPDKTISFWVKGYDTSTYKEFKGFKESLTPQQTGTQLESRWTKPKAEILEAKSITVDFGTNVTTACKVTGYPTPNILWEDDNGETLPSENILLEIPSLYISYVNIENVTVNSTIYCKSKNSQGEDSQRLQVYVYRPFTFDVIETPSDQTIEYGSEGKLYCEVSAYPAAEIKWYHNDTAVSPFDDVLKLSDNNALWIKNMTPNNVGEYKCEMTNEANSKTYSAFVNISGIEAPQVEVEKTNIALKLGDWSYLECRIMKGNPTPTITWTYKSKDGLDFGALPDGAIRDESRLKIASAQTNHEGVYRCDADNVEGHHSADITVQLQYPPSISNGDTRTVIVKEEEDVALPCEVQASPNARVRWEMSQDDVMVALDDRHRTDQQHTHRFKALSKDSGNYHCIAENDIGTAEKTITVNILVAPYIEAPRLKTVGVRAGDSVTLPCNVMFGNPAPTTKWEFIAPDSSTKVLYRNNSSIPLHLKHVSYTDEGSYLCIADNDVGTDSIKIYVKVQ